MNKSRNGTYILGGLVALQVCSMPELVKSEGMLRFATVALLGYHLGCLANELPQI